MKNKQNARISRDICPKNIFLDFFGGGGNALPANPSTTPMINLFSVSLAVRGVYPPTIMALSPHSHFLTPPLFATSTNNFWTLYTPFYVILCVFSVNFGSCQSEIMTQKNKKIQMELVKHIAWFHF